MNSNTTFREEVGHYILIVSSVQAGAWRFHYYHRDHKPFKVSDHRVYADERTAMDAGLEHVTRWRHLEESRMQSAANAAISPAVKEHKAAIYERNEAIRMLARVVRSYNEDDESPDEPLAMIAKNGK